MASESEPSALPWERYRRYVTVLAKTQLDPRWRGKVDLSGVVQQTLLEAHQAATGLRAKEDGQRLAWLRRILSNNLADELRKWTTEARDARREVSLETRLAESSQRLASWLAGDDPSPSSALQREEQVLRLVEALECLPEAQREALLLQHWHGWSLAQIAEHLGRTPAAVAGLLKRGLRTLREQMTRQRGESAP